MKTEEVKQKYSKALNEVQSTGYEQHRWFSSARLRAGYDMTLSSIERHAVPSKVNFSRYLELGPGPSTWTKLFLPSHPNARFHLVDISGEMLGEAKLALGQYANVEYFESDFLKYTCDEKYDFFFSSRAIEYFPDNTEAVKKIAELLKSGGKGFLITKMPKYGLQKMKGQKVSRFHQTQVNPQKMKHEFERNNCSQVKLHPVTFVFPIFKSARLDMFLYRLLSRAPLVMIPTVFIESYSISFQKV